MFREHKAPAGPRPASQSPTRRPRGSTASTAASTARAHATVGPMLSATPSNNHSLFSFGRNAPAGEGGDVTASYEFLPSVSFDDLQSSLETASSDFKLAQFPSPTGNGSILDSKNLPDTMSTKSNVTQSGGTTRVVIPQAAAATRPARSGSILRRPSTSSRPPNTTTIPDAPTAPAAMRNRRQSHYPPVSNSNVGKPPRKSIGPGVVDTDYIVRSHRRRTSAMSNADRENSTQTSANGTTSSSEGPSHLASTRASKARSIHSLSRPSQVSSSASSLTPDPPRTHVLSPRSPRLSGKGLPPSRVSVIPGMPAPSHATGLGARTISPTDTRRLKRISMHHSQSVGHIGTEAPPPPPPPIDRRSASRSPSMIPRKATATPSSSRTTPDPNRKSYSSGLSITSVASYNTVRTSTGSIQPRLPQSMSTPRLPILKPSGHNTTSVNDTDEGVPPVPAIPKAYESPKEFPGDSIMGDKRKTNLAFDASSIHSNSTGSLSLNALPEATTKVKRIGSTRKSSYHPSQTTLDGEKNNTNTQLRKNLQPLRLPPMMVGPLSTPTAAKIAALQDQSQSNRYLNLSPPPSRIIAKTPTTPMTASKTSFFSRNRPDQLDIPVLRSSSSINPMRQESPTPGTGPNSSSESLAEPLNNEGETRKPSISPFLSSSVPKSNPPEQGLFVRSKTGADFGTLQESLEAPGPHKPSGPRALNIAKAPPRSPPPLSSPEEPPTPSSMSSLRQKLSLTWKRSKNHPSSGPSDATDKPNDHSFHSESMPPPRLPISSTVGNIHSSHKAASPTPSTKSSNTYLESRRRKSSTASLNTFTSQDRKRSDQWTNTSDAKKPEPSDATTTERLTLSRNSSVMQKILKPKTPVSAGRRPDAWVADLDKDDLIAEEEMRKMGSRRKETEIAARTLDALRKRATPKERVSAQEAVRIAILNIYERGEIVDYPDVYFCGTQNASKVVGDVQSDAPNFGYDDDRGDYTIVPGDHLAYRYEIIDVLGKGSFGQVVRCIDHRKGNLVAIKIIRNKKRFHQQALVEVNILKKLREWDPANKHSMVNFTDSFYFRGHLCLSTELLDMNLYEFIKANAFRGFSLRLIRRFTKQLLSSLNLLKQRRVIHCDLKPENILLRHPLHSEIKMIDFGSSCFESEQVYTYIQSRFYRSPEVILGMSYSMPIDMWSLGCILAELFTGVPIFPGENEQEQLACIMEVFGPPEKHLIERSTRKKLFFDSMGKPRLTVSSKGRRRRPSSKTLQQALRCDDEAFLDFIARCLRWDPERRMKPEEAIRHEFITARKMPVPRIPTREPSPVRRNTVTAGRPLPEPPGSKISASLRPRESIGISPQKPFALASRRTSAANVSVVGGPTKRISTGMSGISGTSHLPRASVRSVSAKQDIAAAGATAAMGRRQG